MPPVTASQPASRPITRPPSHGGASAVVCADAERLTDDRHRGVEADAGQVRARRLCDGFGTPTTANPSKSLAETLSVSSPPIVDERLDLAAA
jgi:hypothetical protein